LGFLIHFAWGWLCSFFGTIPFGTINVSITEAAIQRGVKVGIFMGIGASIVEFFQSYVALAFFNILTTNPKVERTIIITCIPIFLVIGVYYLLKKTSSMPKPTAKAANVIGAAKGFMLSAFNLIAIPYYVFLGGYLASSNYINLRPQFIAAFACGVVVGSFLVFVLYAKLGQLIKKKSERMSRYDSKIVGMIFIIIAISQAIRYWWNE
jgi:threonine/homoserine/homoserine lactone efflux protein